ncbi:DUF4833 domain-containing protein [Dyadobacter sp. CY312]|uniref:DUF4833 domain-containing protein n=1 Tax=Dyadobacter sp. CY312 TaxID=2907303 RepID=UPI001F1875FF|nr:DUF4833 domain-containing protein [Dyadobacter sp. CY312]MCE7043252.1 DUF4833 domain-containing protein [Dyadobacter sp. CY312]
MKYVISIFLFIAIPFIVSFKGVENRESISTRNLADPDTFPVPGREVPGLLFYIQRDPNTNTIVYELNKDGQGRVREKDPVSTFWIRYPEGGGRKDLNYLQRKFAYGINSKSMGNGDFELRSVAYSKLPLYLRRDQKNQYHVYADIGSRKCILSRVFIRIDGGTFWSPNVLYIELKGVEIATGKIITQRIKPS